MRVTHVITRLIVGGAQENTIATVLGLHNKHDLQVDLISGPTHGPEGSLESAFKLIPSKLQIVPELIRPVNFRNDWIAYQKLTRIFRETKPDIVHTHSGKAGILGRLAAQKAGVPLIVHTIHGPSFGSFQNKFSNFIFRSAERYAARVTTHFVSVAEAMTQQYLKAGIGHPDQYTRIFSGFALKPYWEAQNDPALRQKLGISPEDFVVGKIARLFELKGHEDLFKIAPQLVEHCPKIKFLLVGDGPWRQRFEFLVRSIKLEKHFVFTGLVSPCDVPAYVGIMDLLVHLSRREGLPRALPQSLAAGKPVIAYDCDGANEVCIPNRTGILVPPGSTAILLNSILELANNLESRQKLGAFGQRFVREHFSIEQMVENIYQLYSRLYLERRTRSATS